MELNVALLQILQHTVLLVDDLLHLVVLLRKFEVGVTNAFLHLLREGVLLLDALC